MDQLASHRRAQDVFAVVLANVGPEQLKEPSPCSEWDAQAVIDHVIGGNQWVETRAGHGAGKPLWMQIEDIADQWGFVAKWLNVPAPGPTPGAPAAAAADGGAR